MLAVVITKATSVGDALTIEGTVGGVEVVAHGWVSAVKDLSKPQAIAYAQALLVSAAPSLPVDNTAQFQ